MVKFDSRAHYTRQLTLILIVNFRLTSWQLWVYFFYTSHGSIVHAAHLCGRAWEECKFNLKLGFRVFYKLLKGPQRDSAITLYPPMSSTTTVLLTCVGVPICAFLLKSIYGQKRRYPFPPGPTPKFLVGNALDFPVNDLHKTLEEWGRKYDSEREIHILSLSTS
jgi:hypothetical protein